MAHHLQTRLQTLNAAFRRQTDELAETSDKTDQQVKKALSALTEQTATFGKAAKEARTNADDATETFRKNTGDLLNALESSVSKTLKAGKTFDNQAKQLAKASAEAAEQARVLNEEDLTMRRDLFLKTARFIIEDLNSLSIDLTRLLDADVPDADWKRYTNGDRSIFTRNLLKGKQATLVGRITDKLKAEKKQKYHKKLQEDQLEQIDYIEKKHPERPTSLDDYDNYLPDIDDMDY